MSEPKFESIGTIHYKISNTRDPILLFVPDSNHSLKYSGTSYAVFVRIPQPAENVIREALVVPLRDNEDRGIFLDQSVPIRILSFENIHDVLLQAAEGRASVTVTVTRQTGSDIVRLVGITFPTR